MAQQLDTNDNHSWKIRSPGEKHNHSREKIKLHHFITVHIYTHFLTCPTLKFLKIRVLSTWQIYCESEMKLHV